jgi:hypothetical protein
MPVGGLPDRSLLFQDRPVFGQLPGQPAVDVAAEVADLKPVD